SAQKLSGIPLLSDPQMGCFVTQIADRRYPASGELPLVSDVPLGHVSGLGVDRHIDIDAEIGKEQVPVLRKRVAARITSPWIAERSCCPHVNVIAVWRVGGLSFVEPGFGRII